MRPPGNVRRIARTSPFAPLRHRTFAAVWFGSFVSNIGTWMQTAALGYYVAHTTKSALWAGVIAAAEFAPTGLLAPFGGALADRWSRKALFMSATLLQAALAAVLTVAMVVGKPGAPWIALYAFANGTAWALGFPAFQAIMPELVPKDELPAAIGLSSAQWNLGRVVGPTLGTIVYKVWGVPWVLGTNAVSFFSVVAVLLTVTLPVTTRATGPIMKAIVDGFRFVRREPGLRVMINAMCLNTLLIAPFIGLIPAMVEKELGGGNYVGVLITAQGLGAVVTGLAFGGITQRFGVRRVMGSSLVMLPITLAGYGLAPNVATSAIALFFVGMAYFAALSTFSTIAQTRAPNELRGRVISVNNVVLGLLYPIGLLVQGRIADVTTLRVVTVGAAVAMLATVVAARVLQPGVTGVLDAPIDTAAELSAAVA